MQGDIPAPPDCSICNLPVGLWEPIVVELHPEAEWTTWLRLAADDDLRLPIWHRDCAAGLS